MPSYLHTFPVEPNENPRQFPAAWDPRLRPFFTQLILLGVIGPDGCFLVKGSLKRGCTGQLYFLESTWEDADEPSTPQSAAAE